MKTFILFLAVACMTMPLSAQKAFQRSFELNAAASGDMRAFPPSNSVSHLRFEGNELWAGTSNGLARSTDGGLSWEHFGGDMAFVNDGIFSLAVRGETVWTSTGFDKEIEGGSSVQTGSGYTFSTNSGLSWEHLPQTLDARGDSIISYGVNDSIWILPVVVPEQNVTFEMALSGGTVWIASWASGLRKSTDLGQTWQRILLPPDDRNSLRPTDHLWTNPQDTAGVADTTRRIYRRFDPRNNNNLLAFSVYPVDDDTIWCGTAGGVNKSIDGGLSWTRFTHQNQQASILGNWVITIDGQRLLDGTFRLWITNWRADDRTEDFGVSYTDDGGRTWKNFLNGVRAYDFAFKNDIAYIATEEGIYRTPDGGATFEIFSRISNPAQHAVITSPKVYTVDVSGDTVLIGTGDGIAKTIDNDATPFGSTWTIFRTHEELGVPATGSYAYPNPFSPALEPVRIHYSAVENTIGVPGSRQVSIEIFDFGMNRVRTLINNVRRDASREFDEIWDGRDDEERIVPNGAYFYRITIDDDEPLFGKILVLQ